MTTRWATVGGRRRPTGAAVLGSAVLALVVLGGLVLAVAATDARDAGSVPASGELVPGPRPTSVSDPRLDVRAPTQRPAELLTTLADARARAWREATAALLHAADAPGSAAATRDAAAVTDLARAGLRFTGLRYTVVEVDTVSATGDAAVLRARIDTGAYAVSGPSGSTPRPATTGPPVLVDLVRTDVGWRVSDLRRVP